ncbi:hypothetical protein HUT03_01085 [Candidatus Liberibacter africanus]|uniref:hypothetical protein n=1 Tax=Liberibacter africanus TaxID=34020 RepID=UPI001AEB062E|nr:hypothetical protein [Candidatus Liberibacter africanus]QTP63718.1 hypothetical protein HUT03_01085 [Candidatus Liberibacter africanus]
MKFKKNFLSSKNGNVAVLTALIIPIIIAIIYITVTFAQAFTEESTIASASEEALDHGIALFCSDEIEPNDTVKNILNDLVTILSKNNFDTNEIAQIKKDSSVKIIPIKDPSKKEKYVFELHVSYHMPLSKIQKILAPNKENMNIEIVADKIANCPHNSMVMLQFDPQNTDYADNKHDFIDAINSTLDHKNIILAMISGTFTEMGTSKQTKLSHEIYDKLKFPFFRGIGREEYIDNLGKCSDYVIFNFSDNSCAFNAINDISWSIEFYYKRKEYNKNNISEFSYDTIRKTKGVFVKTHLIQGSQAYSWDIDNVHFIQLNNSLFNGSIFSDTSLDSFEVNINPLINDNGNISQWLIKDASKASKRRKYIVLCTNNLMTNKDAQMRAFQKFLADYHISTIFENTSYESYESTMKDSSGRTVKIYNIVDANKQQFLVLDFTPHHIYVTNYLVNKYNNQASPYRKMSPIYIPPTQ